MFEEVDEYNSLRIIDFGLATFKNVEKYPLCLNLDSSSIGVAHPDTLHLKFLIQRTRMKNIRKPVIFFHAVWYFTNCIVLLYQSSLTGHSVFGGNKFNQLINLNKQCNIDWGN